MALFVGSFVLFRNPYKQLSRIFFVLCLVVSYWSFTKFEYRVAVDYDETLFWMRLSFVWVFPAAILLHLVLVYTGHNHFLFRKWPFMFIYGPPLLVAAMHIFSTDYSGLPFLHSWGWAFEPLHGRLTEFSYFYISLLAIISITLCLRFYFRQPDEKHSRQTLIMLTGITIFGITALLSYCILPILGIRVPDLTFFGFVVGIVGIAGYGILRYGVFTFSLESAAQKIISTMRDAVLLVDDKGLILAVNKATLEMLGYDHDELTGKPIDTLIHDNLCEVRYGYEEIFDKCDLKTTTEIEAAAIKKKGDTVPVSLSMSSMCDDAGRHCGGIYIARDISERKDVEKMSLIQSSELIERNIELAALYRISETVSQTIDIDELLKRSLDSIIDLELMKEVEHKGGIFMVDSGILRLVHSVGVTPEFLEMHKDLKVGECLCGIAARTGEIIISNNCIDDPLHTIHYPGMEPHGHIIIPLMAADRAVGVIYLYMPVNFEISERKKELLQTFGSQIGVALEHTRLFKKTRELSLHDPLTGLANRNLMNVELDKNFARSRRSGEPFCLLMMDLDHFKNYNDRFGHAAGDKLLAGISMIIRDEVREMDIAARYGGEEFLVILPDIDVDRAVEVAERIRAKIEGSVFPVNGDRTTITISVGVAEYEEHIPSAEILIMRADTVLYRAKKKGRNCVEYWISSNTTP